MSSVSRTAILAGIALGVAYTMSPLTVAFAPIVGWGCRYAIRDLEGRERRWVSAALIIAIVVRVLAIVALLVATDPVREQFLAGFPDARFAIARSWWIRNLWFGVPIGPMNLFGIYETYGASSFSYFLAAVQSVLGLAPYGVDLISVAALIGGALLLFRLARHAYGPMAAVPMLFVVLFWPTLLAWSVSALREALQLFLVTVALTCTMAVLRHSTWSRRALEGLGAAVAVYAAGTLRAGALLIIAVAIPLGLIVRLVTLRTWIAAAAVVGVLGAGLALATRPDVRAFVEYQTDLAANRHLGQASTSGRSFRLLDQRFYEEGPQSTFTVTREEAVRFLARSVAALVLVPMPWRASSAAELAIAPQQLVWYTLVALSLLGLRAAWRQDAVLTALLASYVVMGVVVIAPNSGNTGTLVRHRDMIAPIVACLAGVGVTTALGWMARGRHSGSTVAGSPTTDPTGRRRASAIADEAGRLFGWLNPVDAAGALTLLLAIAVSVSTVRVFHTVPPVIDKVEPTVLEDGSRSLRLQGTDFRKYLRVFVGPTNGPLVLANAVNHTNEATWRMRSTSDVELEVPAELQPGTYDLYLYDTGREVAKRSPAFRLARDGTPEPHRTRSPSE